MNAVNRRLMARQRAGRYRARVPGAVHWRPPAMLGRRRLPAGLASWLLDESSLTRRLQERCRGTFQVRVLAQGWMRPLEDERRALELRRGAVAWVRQVHLLCEGRPWVYARTVIPAATLQAGQRHLVRLGERPLGAMLFADRSVRRGAMEVARIEPGRLLHRNALGVRSRQVIWGRRSLFFFGTRPLLVSEIFLPNLQNAGRGR